LQHNCLTFNRSGRRHRLWRFAQNDQWTEVRVNGDRSVDDASLAREFAIAGAGIILKSVLDSRQDLANGRLLRLLPDWDTEPYPLHALLPSGRFIPARVRAFVDFLASKFESFV
jgi:DNA-binding transcriptional LysR family regulator